MSTLLRVLFIADNEEETEVLGIALTNAGYELSNARVETEAELRLALEDREWDLILSDYLLQNFTVLAALEILNQRQLDLPLIVVTGTEDTEVALALIRLGVNDYLNKDNLARVAPVIERELREARSRRSRRETDQALRHFAAVVHASGDAIISTNLDDVIVSWNPAAERLFGWSSAEAIGRLFDRMAPTKYKTEIGGLVALLAPGELDQRFDTVRVTKHGKELDLSMTVSPIKGSHGSLLGLTCVFHDITARKQAESEWEIAARQLRFQIERMPLGYLLLDADFRPKDWNSAAERIFGYSKAEILQMQSPFELVVARPAWPLVEKLFARIRSGDMSANSTSENLAKDGRTLILEWHNTPLYGDDGQFQGVLSLFQDVASRKQDEEALRIRDRAIQAVSQGILIADARQPDNPTIYVSPGFEQITGYPEADVLGRNCRFLQGEATDPAAVRTIRNALVNREPITVELLNYRKNGTTFWNELSISPVANSDDSPTHFVGVMTDVTQRRNLEEQFRQSQKMEAVGQLAGGVAHDFNNILGIILGYCENLSDSTTFDERERDAVNQMRKAAQRAAELTRTLLAFSRKEVLEPKVLNLNDTVVEMDKMLRRLIGEDISLRTLITPTLWYVKVDPAQIEQIILNLAVNARDAMPNGGRLTLETENFELRESSAKAPPELQPGRYVMLSVSDTGHGMDARTKRRIFEPFFTTKDPGKGTGLGLASVYGMVGQSGGTIFVASEIGRGTTFTIYLPICDEPHQRIVETQAPPVNRGGETILLVEDEDELRKLLSQSLRAKGYTVFDAQDGPNAIEIVERSTQQFDIVITDVVMPQWSGAKLADRVRSIRPNVKVLYISGYADDAISRQGILEAETHLLRKPFVPLQLVAKVRELLDSGDKAF